MGRKKIEIRPLADERNRNVTFLKRKAGLMKKAWELSVLCGADVSLMIFAANGKAYEFSSQELDTELDRYLEYEGLIERRRAPEFAAMQEAGESDDDDEEEGAGTGKGGKAKGGKGAAGAADGDKKPVKSLKGKEVYKVKMPSRREIGAASDKKRKRGDKEGQGRPQQGFIDGLVSDSDGDERSRDGSDMANLNYAMNLGPSTAAAQTLASFPSSLPPSHAHPYAQPSYFRSSANPLSALQSSPQLKPHLDAYSPVYGHSAPLPSSAPSMNFPPTMGGLQWDPALLQRYAEFQLQQNHQRQHRLLLQRQREQLALMGVGVGAEGERRLLDDIFGAGGASGRGSAGDGGYPSAGIGGGDTNFLWPTFNTPQQSLPHQQQQQQQAPPQQPQQHHHILHHQHQHQSQHQNHTNTHTQNQNHTPHPTSSVTPDTVPARQHSYYTDDFDFDHRSQSQQPQTQASMSQSQTTHPTPGAGSADGTGTGTAGGSGGTGGTPWYTGLGGDVGRGEEVTYTSPSDFEEMIGRKRAGEEMGHGQGPGQGVGDKRIRV